MVTTMDTHAAGGLNGAGEDWRSGGLSSDTSVLKMVGSHVVGIAPRSAFDRPGCRSKRTRIAGTSGGAMTSVEKSPVSQ